MTPKTSSRGFSAAELLVVLAIAGLAIGVGIPLVNEHLRRASIRQAADQVAVDLKAVRMIAVTRRVPTDFVIQEDPINRYSYTRANGTPRQVDLPRDVRILTSSTPETITFRPDGSVTAAATTVLEITLSTGQKERWTITTSTLGIPTVTKQIVAG